jgi:glyoxylase-like metal-dependent hydrolase (beta-lactamase superfamily II)
MFTTKNVFVLYPEQSSFSCNTYLIIGKEPLLIDPGLHSKKYLAEFIEDSGFDFKDIKKVLLTHAHADHFGSGKFFKNADFICSEEDGGYLKTRDLFYTMSEAFNNSFYPEDIVEISDGANIDLGPLRFKIILTPGHTFGSICLYDENNSLLISGDTLFKDACGRFDLISSDKDSMIKSLNKLLKLEFSVLLPGHGIIYNTESEFQKENIKNILEYLK